MKGPLRRLLDLEQPELVAFIGAGGKSTLMLRLARELAAGGKKTLVTTTTKMGRDQLGGFPSVCQNPNVADVREALATHHLVALISGGDDHKVTGPSPDVVDQLFRNVPVDYLLVEADGARGRLLKAPGPHEPVVPSKATTVVVLMGVDAVGGTPAEVAHRPERVAVLTGKTISDPLTTQDCVTVLTHPRGGLKGVPSAARVLVALTGIGADGGEEVAGHLTDLIGTHPRIGGVVVVGRDAGPPR